MRFPALARRWFRFRLATLFVAITAVCIFLAVHVNSAHRQRWAVGAIEAAGGAVYFDYQDRNSRYPPTLYVRAPRFDTRFDLDTENPTPKWLQHLDCDDFFRTVVAIDLNGTRLTDDQIAEFRLALPYAGVRTPYRGELAFTILQRSHFGHILPTERAGNRSRTATRGGGYRCHGKDAVRLADVSLRFRVGW